MSTKVDVYKLADSTVEFKWNSLQVTASQVTVSSSDCLLKWLPSQVVVFSSDRLINWLYPQTTVSPIELLFSDFLQSESLPNDCFLKSESS